MTEKMQVYKCEVCGNIVEVLRPGEGELVCCEQPMQALQEKVNEEGKEKHVPVAEATEAGTKIKVGSNPHPMEDQHYIEWIAIETDAGESRRFLSPGDAPEATFPQTESTIRARRCYCNVHGLWGSRTTCC